MANAVTQSTSSLYTGEKRHCMGNTSSFGRTMYGTESISNKHQREFTDSVEGEIDHVSNSTVNDLGNVEYKARRNWFSVEVFQFIYLIGVYGTGVSSHQLYLDKSCYLIMNFSKEICENLTQDAHPSELDQVQRHGDNYSLYVTLVGLLPASVMSIFVSNWSDLYGRKVPMIAAVFGILILDIGFLINGLFENLPLYSIVLFAIPSGLSGGYLTINTCVYSFTSEKSSLKMRTFWHSIMEIILLISIPLGTFVGGQLINVMGVKYTPIFVFVVIIHLISILYAALTLSETKAVMKSNFLVGFKHLFSFENIRGSLRTCLRRRDNYGRAQIWLLITSMCVASLGYTVPTDQILYYFCNKMYTWDAKHYSNVLTIISVATIVTLSLSTYMFTRFWQLSDSVLGLLGTVSLILQNASRSFASKEWIFFMSAVLGVLGGFTDAIVRSKISKIVKSDEIGRVFMLYSLFVCTTPVVGAIAATQIYNASLGFYPGLYFALAASWLFYPMCVLLWTNYLESRAH